MGFFDNLPSAVPGEPLPPAGPVTFACRWAARGIPESRVEVDGQLIRDAAERSILLWPAASNQPPEGS